jgi:type VI secretion system protein ImpB
MPRDESLQHKLDRVRKPYVQITYDVQIGDATEVKKLPFVLGVLSDLTGTVNPDEPLPSLKDRKFVEINRDSFNRVMAAMKPRLAMSVPNTLQGDGSKIGVELKFEHIDDFEPESVVRRVEPLRKLLEARQRLSDLKTKIVSNDRLDSLLQEIIHNDEKLKELSNATGRAEPTKAGEPVAPGGEV